ncbi:mitotic checkpoint regulator, MAD2B-interacting-domain-containing protein [Ganoderma leucocontextum]|nr:mitotic checkpoint regulator, MAD2B-interacting-domain-containing protein [Ganoderma leucocontextum]
MLDVESYGSDSDAGSDKDTVQPTLPTSKGSSLTSKLPAPAKKSSLSLSPPSGAASSSKSSSGISLPPPKTKKAKKIAIGLPRLPKDADDANSDDDERPAAKKPRLESGARSSALLSMLPAPKNKAPVLAAPERVLGGGRGPGLIFKSAPRQPNRVITVEDAEEDEDGARQADTLDSSYSAILEEKEEDTKPSPLPFMPTSVKRGKANVSVEEKYSVPVSRPAVSSAPTIDFFSLGSSPSSQTSSSRPSVSPAPPVSSAPGLFSFTAAPSVQEFKPPEPTPEDPYPGYYMLPSGQWAAYDPPYYKKFYDKWKKEYDAHVRALEKGTMKGFEGAEDHAEEVNALKEMEKAKQDIQEREERKALTTGSAEVPVAPKMNIKGAALGGRARSRHQLSTLLTEAYQNRESLEEQIAQGRRNRKEAGNKYGF